MVWSKDLHIYGIRRSMGWRKDVVNQCLEFAHEGCKNTIRESALKVDRTEGGGGGGGGREGEGKWGGPFYRTRDRAHPSWLPPHPTLYPNCSKSVNNCEPAWPSGKTLGW